MGQAAANAPLKTVGGYTEVRQDSVRWTQEIVAATEQVKTTTIPQMNTELNDCKPVYAMSQVVNGINYKIVMECQQFGSTVHYKYGAYKGFSDKDFTLNDDMLKVDVPPSGDWTTLPGFLIDFFFRQQK